MSRKSKAQKQGTSADAKKQAALDHAAAVTAATAALPMLAPFVSRMLREKLAAGQLPADGSAHVRSLQGTQLHYCAVQISIYMDVTTSAQVYFRSPRWNATSVAAGAEAHDGEL